MSWDFETEPEFQAKLDWVNEFVREEVEPLDLVFPHLQFVPLDDKRRKVIDPLKEEVRRRAHEGDGDLDAAAADAVEPALLPVREVEPVDAAFARAQRLDAEPLHALLKASAAHRPAARAVHGDEHGGARLPRDGARGGDDDRERARDAALREVSRFPNERRMHAARTEVRTIYPVPARRPWTGSAAAGACLPLGPSRTRWSRRASRRCA
jgi:hypothetical protein